MVTVVCPACSTKLVVFRASPSYQGWSKRSVHTSRSGTVISLNTPPMPISARSGPRQT
jgi:hypothetical protein